MKLPGPRLAQTHSRSPIISTGSAIWLLRGDFKVSSATDELYRSTWPRTAIVFALCQIPLVRILHMAILVGAVIRVCKYQGLSS